MNIIWFRRDLRISDNIALSSALKHGTGTCKAIFIETPEQWKAHNTAPIQVDFLERHLNLLSEKLENLGIPFDVLSATNYPNQVDVLAQYCEQFNVKHVFANTEVEINEQLRDQTALHALKAISTQLHLFECDVIVNKGAVLNKEGEMYKVFTPFKNSWVKHIQLHGVQLAPKINQSSARKPISNSRSHQLNFDKVSSNKWPLVTEIEETVLPDFFDHKHFSYKENRDFPARKGTSGISPYLAIGALSPRAVFLNALQTNPHMLENPKSVEFTWVNELAWRDFYKHLLFHFPELCKHTNFQPKFNTLRWPNSPYAYTKWCNGETGYPIVDAAMKQLTQTGWMHNRLRMIVASFLTKHLLIDWRLGEKFFMQHLIDGDFSANNGGWQWAAGTGCDAQPYFRIFNPITQSEKFDPNGDFIRKYIKGLENVPSKHIHFPHEYLKATKQTSLYVEPIVDHKSARLTALDFYKQ